MSKDELPSINDILGDNNLPSYKDFLEKKEELPSVEEYISESNQNTLEEETQTIEDANGESFLEVTDVIQTPEWSELVRLVNDVRKDIPKIPEIRYYDEQLEEICEKISQIQQDYVKSDKIDALNVQNENFEGKLSEIEAKIPTVKYYDHDINSIYDKITDIKEEIKNLPEVKYYEEDLESLKSKIERVNEAIPTFPDWIQKVQEVPDFSWIGKTFSIIDDDFNKVQGHLDLIKEKIDREVNVINESIEVKEFEFKVDVKNLNENLDQTNDRITKTKDRIYEEIKESSIRIWELRNTFKDDDKKLKKSILSEQNKLKQSLEKQIEKIDEQSVKADESILNFFTNLKETVDNLPEVKYYDEDISSIKGDISSLKTGLKELNEISSLIKKDQKVLEENYLLNEPPSEKENAGNQTDALTPLDQKFATLDDLSNHYRLFINRITTQLSTIGGGGAGFIKDLDDVDITGLQNNYILKWDDPNNKWIVASGGNIGAGGTWHTDSIGISTTKSVGINTSSAVTGKSLYVDGDVQFTGNLSVGGTITKEDIKNLDSIGIITARSGITVTSNGLNVSGVSTISTGIGTVHIGVGQTTLLVDGDARVTGILTIGRGSITLDPNSKKITGVDEIIVGTAVTVSIKQDTKGNIAFEKEDGSEASVGIGTTVSINTTGIITAASFSGDGSQLSNIISGVGIQSGSVRVGTGFTDVNFTGTGVTIVGSGKTITVNVPTATLTRQTETITGVTTVFAITGGYDVGLIDVYVNGAKQISGSDYTASNGTTVTMTPFVNNGDVVEFQKIDQLRVAGITSTTSAGNAFNLNSQPASHYLDYDNFTNTPTIPTNTNQLTNGAGFITTSFTNTNQLTNGAGFITGSSSGVELTGIVTSIVAGDNITISGSTGIVTITSTASGGGSGISTISGVVNIANDLDVDGHTNLDNVSIAGVVTATSFSGDGSGLTNTGASVAKSSAIASFLGR